MLDRQWLLDREERRDKEQREWQERQQAKSVKDMKNATIRGAAIGALIAGAISMIGMVIQVAQGTYQKPPVVNNIIQLPPQTTQSPTPDIPDVQPPAVSEEYPETGTGSPVD